MSSASELHSPTALPRATWKDTLKRTVTEFKEDKLNHWGAALTYYAVLSLFPALLVLVSLVGLFVNAERATSAAMTMSTNVIPSCSGLSFQNGRPSSTS